MSAPDRAAEVNRLAVELNEAVTRVAHAATELREGAKPFHVHSERGTLMVELDPDAWQQLGQLIVAWTDAGEAFLRAMHAAPAAQQVELVHDHAHDLAFVEGELGDLAELDAEERGAA